MKVAFDHPANAAILAQLERGTGQRPENRSAPPTVYDLHRNPLGTHPDLADLLWNKLTILLPEPCGWVVNGRPVLVHPSTGVLFGWAAGTHDYALRATDGNWIPGSFHRDEPLWCLAAYEWAGLTKF